MLIGSKEYVNWISYYDYGSIKIVLRDSNFSISYCIYVVMKI